MQNRKRPADIIRFAAPGNRKTHTQVKTHRLRILFIDIDRIGFLAGDGPLHQLASAARGCRWKRYGCAPAYSGGGRWC